jgi:serine/threonine protein kinase
MSSTDPSAGHSPGVHPEVLNRESLVPGTRVGDFDIIRVIGSGGFGTVYLALDSSLDREVAVKEFLPAHLACRVPGQQRVKLRSQSFEAKYKAGLQSFVNEAKILARFNHPGIVKVHRFWEANGTAYMAMPFVHGPTLRDVRYSMKESPTEAWLRGVLDPLLDALSMLHAEGIFHRDIAPDNILLPNAREPVLLDFGAARRVIGDHMQTFTAVLKPSYAPIEQYAEASQLRQGPWTDLYALGAVVVYMLNAMPPPPSTVRLIHDEMPLLLQDPPAGVSASFLAAVQWALAVRPQDRPQSVQQFRNALDGRIVVPVMARRGDEAPSVGLSTDRFMPGQAARDAGPPQQTTVAFARHGDPASFDKPQSVAWDTTNQLASTPPVAEAQPGAAEKPSWPMSSAVQERFARLRQGVGDPPRATLIAAGLAVLFVSGAAFGLLKSQLSDSSAATWHELGRHVKSSEVIIEERAEDSRPVPPLDEMADSVAQHVAPLALTAAVTSASTAALGAREAKPATMMANVVAPRAATANGSNVKLHDKRVAVKKQPQRPKSAKLAQWGPRETCSGRNFISEAICINRKCDEPRYKRHPQCLEFAQHLEERMRRGQH